MRKWVLFLLPLLLLVSYRGKEHEGDKNSKTENNRGVEYVASADFRIKALYDSISCNELDPEVFKLAYKGYQRLKKDHAGIEKDIITVIDFNKPSTRTRMFVIDLKKEKIIQKGLVAHGRNSGVNIASRFSNKPNSLQSSLGFFLVGETYIGKHGLSLRLDGLEHDINDNARTRNIVIHNADYVSKQFVKKAGRLGRSFGCPAFPKEGFKDIVNTIKGGSLLFIYSSRSDYLEQSDIL